MQRVAIIGSPGSGKSTLARDLQIRTHLPVIHLDAEFWRPGWKPSDMEEFRRRVAAIHKRDRWIIDGHYFPTLDDRLARADTVFYLDYPTRVCLARVIRRMLRGRGNDRSDCAPGCPERFNPLLLHYVTIFRVTFRKKTLDLLRRHAHLTIHRFEHPSELSLHLDATGITPRLP